MKPFPYSWEAFESIEDIPVESFDLIRQTLLFTKTASCNTENRLQFFWHTVLLPYYDRSEKPRLNADALGILYLLSNQIPIEIRQITKIYRSLEDIWYSLEDWRREYLAGLSNPENIPAINGDMPELPWI